MSARRSTRIASAPAVVKSVAPPSAPAAKRSKATSKTNAKFGSTSAGKAPAGARVQTARQRGLPSVPPELLHEIISHLSDNMSLQELQKQPRNMKHHVLARSLTLRALSQTCHQLREMCLPLHWERVFVCTTCQPTWYQEAAERLRTKSEGLVANPELAIHVRIMTVVLTRCNAADVLAAFSNCLSYLPNLNTLEIPHAHSEMSGLLKTAFEGRDFPQIRRVVLPACAHQVLRACSGVQEVVCIEEDGSKLVGAIAKACKNVQMFQGLRLTGDGALMKRLHKAAPNLHSIGLASVGFAYLPRWIKACTMFKNLAELEVWISCEDKNDYYDDAHSVLRASKANGKKTYTVRHFRFQNAEEHARYIEEGRHYSWAFQQESVRVAQI